MSKSNIRKITVDPTKCNTDSRRPSVFERLGTKPAVTPTAHNTSDYCRNWALNGSCSYGKNCKYASSHTLISPSKRAKKDNAITNTSGNIEDSFKRLTSKVVKKPSHSPDLDLEEWNQTDLEYEDEKVLERRRQLLQRELEIQMKKDKEIHNKEKIRQKKKAMSSSSSSRTSSTSSSTSSSSSEDSSSSSTSDSRKKVKKVKSKRHHNMTNDYDEDKERRRKLKLKRLGVKNEKSVSKKKRKVDASSIKKDISTRAMKKCTSSGSSRKHSSATRGRSPSIQVSQSVVTSTPPTLLGSSVSVPHHASSTKMRERNRSESPKAKSRVEKDDRHYKKMKELEDAAAKESAKRVDKIKEQDKEKSRAIEEKVKVDERLKTKCKEKEVRSKTPSVSDRSKHQYVKEGTSSKSRRSRTPEKSSIKSKQEGSLSRLQERHSSSGRSRDSEKKDRDVHKSDKSKDREDIRKVEQSKLRQSLSQEEGHRNSNKNINGKELDEKSYLNEKARQKSRECREKEHAREDRSHARFGREREKEKEDRERQRDRERERERERERDRERDKERERERERDRERDRDRDRERDRERDRDKESSKIRDRDVPSLVSSVSLNLSNEKNARYGREKERVVTKDATFEKTGPRDRRNERERERSESKALGERDRNSSQRFDSRYEKESSSNRKNSVNSPRDRVDRFPQERSLDRATFTEKGVHPSPSSATALLPVPSSTTSSSSSSSVVTTTLASTSSRDHLIDAHYDRDRHRRFGSSRYERGHGSDHDRKESRVTPTKVDRVVERRDSSPRRGVEIERTYSNRNYGRLGSSHWEDQEEVTSHLDYRDHHVHGDDRRKLVDGSRRYDSPFDERRGNREERSRDSRYMVQSNDRSFEDHHHHHHHHRHTIYNEDKLCSSSSGLRDEAVSGEDWEAHHRDVEHSRDRAYTVEWEEREWRARALWGSRDSLPGSEIHEDEWSTRYDSSLPEWKANENRKWDSQSVHVHGHYRNERSKEVELGESTSHGKRRPYSNSEVREDCSVHTSNSKQAALYGNMKEEPINKKLMELAEGRLHTSKEKSAEVFQKKPVQKEKSETKETHLPEPKRSCIDESLPTLHTESDLSDISDDPDDILNMEEEVTDESSKTKSNKIANNTTPHEQQSTVQETTQSSPKELIENNVFSTKEKDNTVSIAFRNIDDENIEAMDFEEISDGELEEDIKTSGKGLGDALGVDWESFVKEMQPRRLLSSGQHSEQNRWQCKTIFHRIGVSFKYAGEEYASKLSKKYEKEDHVGLFLDNVALVHTAIARSQLLHNLGSNLSSPIDDIAYRQSNMNSDEPEPDSETLKPCTALYDTAKCLLQQAV